MAKNDQLWPLLAIGGIALWAFSRRGEASSPIIGSGPLPGESQLPVVLPGEDPVLFDPIPGVVDPFPEYHTGPANVGGTVGSVVVVDPAPGEGGGQHRSGSDPAPGSGSGNVTPTWDVDPGEPWEWDRVDPWSVGLGAHKVAKEAGDSANVRVTFSNNTTDFQGNPIVWPVRIRAEIGASTGILGVGGWDDMARALGNPSSSAVTEYNAASGSSTEFLYLTVGDEPNNPKTWDVRVTMSMQGSTAAGAPNGTWHEVAKSTHQGAIETINPTGPSAYGGDLSSIWVSNNRERSQMQRLGMGQSRPPWGIAVGEVRSWPTSDRNPTLPGVKIRVRQDRKGSPIGPGYRVYAV